MISVSIEETQQCLYENRVVWYVCIVMPEGYDYRLVKLNRLTHAYLQYGFSSVDIFLMIQHDVCLQRCPWCFIHILMALPRNYWYKR